MTEDTETRILRAAHDLLLARGVKALTLERVAAQAKLSKGAVLYHFVTKDALIDAMLRAALAQCQLGATSEVWQCLVRTLMAVWCVSPRILAVNRELIGLMAGWVSVEGNQPDIPSSVIGHALVAEMQRAGDFARC